jgi:hypothetical protein
MFKLLYQTKMKNIYSILSIPLNTTLNERVSIGLIMSNGEKHFFKYSLSKLQVIKSLLSSESYLLLKTYLKSIDKEISKLDGDMFKDSLKWINDSYLSYLSRYSNNLVEFSQPKTIDIEFSEKMFQLFYSKYIFVEEFEIIKEHKVNIFNKVKRNLHPSIENKVNINFTVTSQNLENIFAPVEVNFIGMNGAPVAGQVLDFTKSHFYLESDLTRYISLSKALELEGERNGKYFVIGNEPKKNINPKNHILWNHIRETKFLEFVSVKETGKIKDYINERDVRPYFIE